MLEKEDLRAIAQLMDQKLEPMHQKLDGLAVRMEKTENRLDRLEDSVSELKEDTAVTREAVNTLLAWAEKAEVQVQVPLLPRAENQ